MTLRRRFGTQTTWYLHSQTVCDRLFFTSSSFPESPGPSLTRHRTERSFFYKYCSIAFVILPGGAGGLALELAEFLTGLLSTAGKQNIPRRLRQGVFNSDEAFYGFSPE